MYEVVVRTTAVPSPPLPYPFVAVLFIGAIVGATVETIELNRDDDVPHNYGAVSRWIVMYPVLPLVILYMAVCGVEM